MSFDLDAALEALARRIDRVESDRVARMAELERIASNAHALALGAQDRVAPLEALVRDSDSALFDAAVKRIEALERDHSIERQAHRIDALEELRRVSDRMWNATIPDLVSRVRALDPEQGWERERRADWMRTRDAALTGLLAKSAGEGVHNDEFIRAATVFADRAHGPLEAPIEQDTLPARPPLHIAQKRADAHMAFAPNVEALVKVARAARDYCRDCGGGGYITADELDAALKPFETEHGE